MFEKWFGLMDIDGFNDLFVNLFGGWKIVSGEIVNERNLLV